MTHCSLSSSRRTAIVDVGDMVWVSLRLFFNDRIVAALDRWIYSSRRVLLLWWSQRMRGMWKVGEVTDMNIEILRALWTLSWMWTMINISSIFKVGEYPWISCEGREDLTVNGCCCHVTEHRASGDHLLLLFSFNLIRYDLLESLMEWMDLQFFHLLLPGIDQSLHYSNTWSPHVFSCMAEANARIDSLLLELKVNFDSWEDLVNEIIGNLIFTRLLLSEANHRVDVDLIVRVYIVAEVWVENFIDVPLISVMARLVFFLIWKVHEAPFALIIVAHAVSLQRAWLANGKTLIIIMRWFLNLWRRWTASLLNDEGFPFFRITVGNVWLLRLSMEWLLDRFKLVVLFGPELEDLRFLIQVGNSPHVSMECWLIFEWN